MSAIIAPGAPIRQLDLKPQPDQQITTADAADPERLSRVIQSILRNVATLRRRWAPAFIDYRDITVDATGTARFAFPHGFGQAVNYWPVKWSGAAAPNLRVDATSDANTLYLTSTSAGLVTVRVEIAG